jgi:hypothetical protein
MTQHDDPGLPSIDTSVRSVARMYDYYLGGKDNLQVDRDTVDRVLQAMPEMRRVAREIRAFLRRAVRYLGRRRPQESISGWPGSKRAPSRLWSREARLLDPSVR